jgi:hypothetical protein
MRSNRRTEVVRTPQSSTGGVGVGAAGVSMNSKSSETSECVFDILSGQGKDLQFVILPTCN